MEISKDQDSKSKLIISKAARKYIKTIFLLQFRNKCAAKRIYAVYLLLPYIILVDA